MNNEFPDVKETIDEIEVPYDKLDRTIEFAIKRGKAKRSKPKRTFSRIIGVAALAIGVVISSTFLSPTAAKMLSSIPLLSSVFELIGDKGLEIASQKGLSTRINQTAVDQNISLTIQDIFYDGTRLSISYVHDAVGTLWGTTLKVNGQDMDFLEGQSGGKLKNGQFGGILNIDPSEELPEAFQLSLSVGQIGEVEGEWDFLVAVEAAEEEILTIEPMQTTTFKDTTMTVKSIKIGPSAITLSIDITQAAGNANAENSLEKNGDLNIKLLNHHGEALAQLDGRGTGEEIDGEMVSHMEYRFAPLEEQTDYLMIMPYVNPLETKDYQTIEQPLRLDELPTTIDHGDVGKVVITDVQYEVDKTLLHYYAESDFPYSGHINIYPIWLKDAAGNLLTIEAKGYPKRIAPHTYVKEFQPVSESEPLTIMTFEQKEIEIVEEMQVKIPLK